MGGSARRRFQDGADAGRHRHFGERHQEPAIGNIVDRGDQAVADQLADEIAVAPLGGEIDRRRRALFAAADFAQIKRLAEPAARLADQQDRLALGLERERHRFGEFVEQTDAADGRRRQDRPAVGLVVERDIAGHDREIERAAGFADAADAADELAHDFRPLRIAEIEVVGDRQRPRADRGEIAPGFGDRLLAALERIGLAIARRDVGGQRQRLRAPP